MTGRVADMAVAAIFKRARSHVRHRRDRPGAEGRYPGARDRREQLGGRIGDQGLVANDQAVFALGETICYISRLKPRDGPAFVGALAGKWNIERDATGDFIALAPIRTTATEVLCGRLRAASGRASAEPTASARRYRRCRTPRIVALWRHRRPTN